ncbi:MAG: putative porin, partial [Candidatus Margulisbacteria bacterium]|nr:putative porin [Candidatus Margulisiibacteriota bacterium]
KNFNLDQAYLSYAPAWVPSVVGKFKATVGKFDVKEGVYTVTNGVWDSNISLEGKNLNYTYKDVSVKGLDLFANIGSYVLAGDVNSGSERQGDGTSISGGGSPIVLEAKQLGVKWKIADYSVETAYAQYAVPAWNISEGTSPSGIKTPDDKSLDHIAVKLGANFKVPYFEKVALLYEDIVNHNEIGITKSKDGTTSGESDEVSNRHASAYGVEFGAKIGLPYLQDYSLRYLQRKIENGVGWTYMEDAHKDQNTEGSQIALTVGIVDNVSFTIDQYSLKYIDQINDSNASWKDTRFEINVKF